MFGFPRLRVTELPLPPLEYPSERVRLYVAEQAKRLKLEYPWITDDYAERRAYGENRGQRFLRCLKSEKIERLEKRIAELEALVVAPKTEPDPIHNAIRKMK